MEANLEELKMQVANLIARVSMAEAQIAEMDDDMPEQPSASIAKESGSSSEPEYASYFKVYDASSGGSCKIGVKDGSAVDPDPDYCGGVYVNGDKAMVEANEFVVSAVGTYDVWLHSWMAVADDSPYVAGANGIVAIGSEPVSPAGVGYSNQLLGRVSVVSDGNGGFLIGAINQDYLSGGEHHCVIVGDCEGEVPES